MISRFLTILSLCCAILCAFVGYMSHRAIEESRRVTTSSIALGCGELMEKPPRATTEVVIDRFIVGKRKATFDFDGDDQWDLVGVPIFPSEKQSTKYGYRAVIVCCKGIPDEAALQQAFPEGLEELAVDFWPGRQELDGNVHSRLAMNYRNLDFSKSPVVFLGYERTNPLLGPLSFRLSWLVGLGSVGLALLTLVVSLVMGLLGKLFKRKPAVPQRPKANRAGLPSSGNQEVEPTGGVLDRVRSMREKQPDT